MGIFNYVSELSGCDKPFVARIKLNENVDIEKGEIVYFIEENHRATTVKSMSDSIAGVCAKTYKSNASDLIPSYGLGMIDVIVSPNALYRTPACVIEDSVGGQSKAVMTGHDNITEKDTEGYVGSKLILKEKGENSTNPNAVGTVFNITGTNVVNNIIGLTTDKNVYSCKGDKYIFVPQYGFDLLYLKNANTLDIQFEGDGDFMVVDADETGYTVKIKNVK
ncbi:MAG: hypothetical protein IKI97_10085 [Clostridia bacterium]|nr:hypothetical protein [Clostridia bacterium]